MILREAETGDLLIELDGIIVVRIVKIVEEKFPGITKRFEKVAGEVSSVSYPTSLEEAELMEKLGFHYIQHHAPWKLTEWGLERPSPIIPKQGER